MLRLYIAEKPSLARAIADALGNGKKKNGCIEIDGGEDVVTWCFGHILEQYDPDEYDAKYKHWVMDDLPIVPETWKLKVKKDATSQYKIIKELVARADEIVNAGDPDREGQLLVDEVLLYIGNKKPVRRILLNALDKKSVREALGDLRDNRDFIGLRDSALARSQADWLVGMNLTRAYTIKSREAGYDNVVHVGRVQTPTLALVVRREEEIKNFKPTTHYALQVFWMHENGSIRSMWRFKEGMDGLDAEKRLLSKDVAERLLQKLQSSDARIASVEQKEKKEEPRLPYSLSSLQVDAGRKYGLSPQQVLNVMQGLYEKGLTTYPRSDCEYLPTNQQEDVTHILQNLSGMSDVVSEEHIDALAGHADETRVSRAWNDEKISAHHALIPTTEAADLTQLTDDEQKLYLLVAKAYIAQFFPAHIYQTTKLTITCADEEFVATGKTILKQGWKEVYQKDMTVPDDQPEEEEQVLPVVVEGDIVTYAHGSAKEKVTKPPKRFTESTLLQAMKEIYKYVRDKDLSRTLKDCKGIGTEATRAGIIEGLKAAKTVKLEKKNLVPTDLGHMVINILPEDITYPDITALWEADLDRIASGDTPIQSFSSKQHQLLNTMLAEAKRVTIAENKEVPHCPECGKVMRLRKGKSGTFWGCSGYPDCKTTAPDKDGKPNFSANTEKRRTAICPACGKNLRQIKGKFGTFWSCEDREHCNMTFPDHENNPVIVKCPECEKGYLRRAESKKKKGAFYWYCSERCGANLIWDKNGQPDIHDGR